MNRQTVICAASLLVLFTVMIAAQHKDAQDEAKLRQQIAARNASHEADKWADLDRRAELMTGFGRAK